MRRSDPAEDTLPQWQGVPHLTPGLLPSALRPTLRLIKIAAGDLVEPLDFIARLSAKAPKPRVNVTLASEIICRKKVTPRLGIYRESVRPLRGHWDANRIRQLSSAVCVRRDKAAFLSGCESHPANSLRPEAIGAVMEVTKWLKPLV